MYPLADNMTDILCPPPLPGSVGYGWLKCGSDPHH